MTNEQILELLEEHIERWMLRSDFAQPYQSLIVFRNDLKARMEVSAAVRQPQPLEPAPHTAPDTDPQAQSWPEGQPSSAIVPRKPDW